MSEGGLALTGSLLSLLGALLFLVAALGLLRLPDYYTRIHAPTKAATLGLLLVSAGSILLYEGRDATFWLEKVLLVLFVLITVPVSTQMMVRGAAARGVPHAPETRGEPVAEAVGRVDEGEDPVVPPVEG
jgi:multicomponent K+:H+ antiporter subunit G